uniref:Uncharacterized protein n=1 Tax=Solanum tuberosum TaxID=4113 RepID=M1CAN3_SOLTU
MTIASELSSKLVKIQFQKPVPSLECKGLFIGKVGAFWGKSVGKIQTKFEFLSSYPRPTVKEI